jgi:ornithine cyclodeaminase/alanine dehydrogenase-like protein (mu-crystallin family)
MIQIDDQQLEKLLTFDSLLPALQQAFCDNITVPLRHHHNFDNPREGIPSTLLLMPAWKAGDFLGIKIVLVSPNNSKYQLPTIQGQYLLFDAHKGRQLAMMDAKVLTNRRTAAASALASSFLSRPNSQSLLMIGTGSLAPHLIEAHASVRPINQVWIWGRDFTKARQLAKKLDHLDLPIEAIPDQKAKLSEADIISCATLSPEPLVFGQHLRPGQHIDLVGSYLPTTREADDEAISRAIVYADNLEGAPKESGDLAIPIQKGIIKIADIKGDLFSLCRENVRGRQHAQEITLFKSVGHALEDLAAAVLAYDQISQ